MQLGVPLIIFSNVWNRLKYCLMQDDKWRSHCTYIGLYIYIYIYKNSELLYTFVCAHTHIHMYHGSWDSVVGIVTKLQMIKLRKSGFIHCKSQKLFFFPKNSD
jgi:hypothetical protein